MSVWVVDSRGNILLTLCDPQKESYPSRWENTGGSALAGETSLQATRRELDEEAGIVANETELILLGTQTTRDSFVDHYLLKKDVPLSATRLQAGEPADVKWVTMQEFEGMIEDFTLAKPIGDQFNGIRELFLAVLKKLHS